MAYATPFLSYALRQCVPNMHMPALGCSKSIWLNVAGLLWLQLMAHLLAAEWWWESCRHQTR